MVIFLWFHRDFEELAASLWRIFACRIFYSIDSLSEYIGSPGQYSNEIKMRFELNWTASQNIFINSFSV